MRPFDVAIVGAGPAGLASALYLKRAGHKPVIFERFPAAAPVGSGLILQPTGLSVLADLGLLEPIMALGHRIDRLHGLDGKSGRQVLNVSYNALPGGRFGLAVNRHALFSVLADAVASERIEILTGCHVTDMEAGRGGRRLLFDKGGTSAAFDLIVDTSGARSGLRRHAKHPAEPKPLPYGALWATLDWQNGSFDTHALSQRYDKASVMAGVLPTGRTEHNGHEKFAFFWSLKPDDLASLKAAGLEEWKNVVVSLWPECAVFLDQIGSFEAMTLAKYGHHTLRVPAGDGVVFVGDSAHSTSPQLGQGANMALLDAYALGQAALRGADIPATLDVYSRSRRRHVAVFQAMSVLFTPFYQSDSSALAFVRDQVVARLARIPPAQKILASMVCGTLVDPFSPIGLTEKIWQAPLAKDAQIQ